MTVQYVLSLLDRGVDMPKLEAGCGVDLVAFVTGGGGEQARGGGFHYRFTIKTVSIYHRFPINTVSIHYRFPIKTVSIYYHLNQNQVAAWIRSLSFPEAAASKYAGAALAKDVTTSKLLEWCPLPHVPPRTLGTGLR